MPATPIVTDVGSVFYDVGNATVEVADTLGGVFAALASGTLRLNQLVQEIAPGVDQATLTFLYGVQMEEGDTTFAAIAAAELLGKFVKVTLPDTIGSDDLVWYGVIDADDRNVMGSQATTEPTGVQQVTAYGLLRLFERTRITTANIYVDADNVLTIGRGLAFNRDQEGRFSERGNRSTLEYEQGLGVPLCFVFSEKPRGETAWSAYEAVKYLLALHPPVDSAGYPLVTCVLSADPDSLSWFEFSLDTDGKTLKELLDALIDRRRGLSYRVDFTEEDPDTLDPAILTVTAFTFADETITLPSGKTLAANPNLRTLDFEAAFDIEQCLVSNLALTKYDKVIARGQFKTSTCTLKFTEPDNPNPKIIPAWDADELLLYQQAANQEVTYAALSVEERQELNALTRSNDDLAYVFSRFTLSPSFLKKVSADSKDWWVAPLYDEATGDPLKSEGTDPGESTEGEPLWLRGIRFERFLPLRDRRDYSGTQIDDFTFGDGLFDYGEPEYLRPFVFTNTNGSFDGSDPHWVTLDRLAEAQGDDDRKWACSLRLLDAGPQLQLDVHGGPQHFIAKPDDMTPVEDDATPGTNVGTYSDRDDPADVGIPWTDFYATLCLRLDSRIEAEAEINTPAAGAEQRILTIDIPDARLDYVVPHTVVGLSKGKVVNSSSGGFVRDDREWLEDIARAAAEWYGKERQALRLKWKQCRKLVEPGWLITDIGANYNRTGVNTVISKVTYTLTENAVSTEIETAFASLDLA